MSVSLTSLVNYCEELLNVKEFKDYSPNGLQVQGKETVQRIVTGVTASQALLDAAVQYSADLVLVHHGYFWRGESECITGMKKRRLATLLGNDISLLGFHLPLDAHPEFGNNAMLAKKMGWQITRGLDAPLGRAIGMVGELPEPISGGRLAEQLAAVLERTPLHIQGIGHPIKKIAWCTGGAQGFIDKALAAGVDAYISGEVSEPTYHFAKEMGIDYFAAGHHATERYGVQALGEHLASKFGIEHRYIEIPNPV
ncbi:Nif3-like dinuclear metal center hexameric protein [Neptunomonas phycophila]|uniref:Nif3-like dinuclear metal center hexameric protein n=1 Tax=Neptunomonas phycophila TaxID=1572645 RepID=UPI0026E3E30E|nr:Nif3-like dinuclear metal center hexameric protein [Neptunomonas phycophila]MDO6783638.1 Nif3-like dinuclear metal center hexameric protein [Neptunomonas phycophila]